MKLHIIGAGCPDPSPVRYGSAFCLELPQEKILVDCGPATTWKLSLLGIHPKAIDTLLFTHHHTDHNIDFPCFAMTRWDIDNGKAPDLKILGPPPTRAFCETIMSLDGPWAVDLKARIESPASEWCHEKRGGSLPRWAPRTDATDISPDFTLETPNWSLTCAEVQHLQPWITSLGYRIDTAQGSVVFAGDCTDCDGLRRLAKGADAVVMCCTFFADSNMDKVISDAVAGVPEVIALINDAQPKRVILTHANPNFHAPGKRERAVAQIARATVDCEILFPDERVTIQL